jgi:hypothetical protein
VSHDEFTLAFVHLDLSRFVSRMAPSRISSQRHVSITIAWPGRQGNSILRRCVDAADVHAMIVVVAKQLLHADLLLWTDEALVLRCCGESLDYQLASPFTTGQVVMIPYIHDVYVSPRRHFSMS